MLQWILGRPVVSTLVVLGVGLAAGSAHAELTNNSLGYPVRIWGSLYGRSFAGEYLEVDVMGGGFLPKSPTDNTGTTLFAVKAIQPSTSNFTTIITDTKKTVIFEPDKSYQVEVSMMEGDPTGAKVTLHAVAPPGYRIEMDSMVRSSYQVNGPSHQYFVRLVSDNEPFPGRAGTASSLASDRLRWRVALGSLKNGTSAGSLAIVDAGNSADWSSIFTPAGLQYETDAPDEVKVYRQNNQIRQIRANEACVDVVTLSATAYELRFFPKSRLRAGSTEPRDFDGFPYVTYRIEQDGGPTQLKITSETRDLAATFSNGDGNAPATTIIGVTNAKAPIARTAVTTVQRSGAWPTFTWSRRDWTTSGQNPLSEETRVFIGPEQARSESFARRVPNGAVALQGSRNFSLYSWGEVPAGETLGATSSPVSSTLAYYDGADQPGSHGYLKSVRRNSGEWEAYEYWDAAANSNRTGTLKYRYRPFNASPANVSFDPALGEVVYFEYDTDAFGMLRRPKTIRTTVEGKTVAEATITYTNQLVVLGGTSYNIVSANRIDRADALTSLQSSIRYFREDTYDAFFRNQIYSTTEPGGVRRSFAYQRGDFDEATGAFTVSASGAASRIAVITGTTGPGSPCPTYEGFDVDDLNLVEGKSTVEVVVRDSAARVRRTETYAWSGGWQLVSSASLLYDLAGLLTDRTHSNGATYHAVYRGELKSSETDDHGVTVSYTYDAAGRIDTAQKSSGPTTTLGYDAANHIISRTLSASGVAPLVSSFTYDDAGRLKNETPAGLGRTDYSYDVANRQRTITLPPDGANKRATRIETAQIDGRLTSITGTAVVSEFYTYVAETDGRQLTQVSFGGAASPRWVKSWTDRLGRTMTVQRPGFGQSSQPIYTEDFGYDTTTGRLNRIDRTGLAATRFEYDALGQPIRRGLDVDGNGLMLASNDRITDSDQYFESYAGAWWLRRDIRAYPVAGSGTAVTSSIIRDRLTGFSGTRRGETQTTDIEGNTSIDAIDVAGSTVTITATLPGLASTAQRIETIVNGLRTSVKTFDGLTYATQYDALDRVWKEIDPRNSNTTTFSYYAGSVVLEKLTDQANNTTTFGYDALGQRTWVKDALNQVSYTAYNLRGQLLRQWGPAATAVEYAYNPYGERIAMRTFRDRAGSFDVTSWPRSDGGTDSASPDPTLWTAGDITKWLYDEPSGLLWKKIDAAGNPVVFDYNNRGQTATRTWARGVATGYGYDPVTGELTGKSYSDAGAPIPTPPVAYTYTRLGQLDSVSDVTGARDLVYDPAAPWRLATEALDSAFYAGRVLRKIYDTSTGTGGGYGPYTAGFVKGRPIGFELGIVSNTGRDLRQQFTTSDLGRFVGVNTRAVTDTARDFVYSYTNGSALLSGYSVGSFNVAYDYEAGRDVRTRVEAKWGTSTSVARFDSAYDELARRRWSKQSGMAFADYTTGTGYGAVYNWYGYNSRGELKTAAMFRGDTPPATGVPASGDELYGRRFEYRYDAIGNRTSAGPTGSAAGSDDEFVAGERNQYSSRENNTVRLLGTAAAGANVAAQSGGAGVTVAKKDRSFAGDLLPSNIGKSAHGTVAIYAAIPGTGGAADLLASQTRTWFVSPQTQTLRHDDDGNLISDDVWDYTYDAENRLVRMKSALPAGFGFTRQQLDFKYDYLGRRVEKKVNTIADNGAYTEVLVRRYVYDGWALVAETDAAGAIKRSYAWGLDLAGGLDATGGVGALLQMTQHNAKGSRTSYFPAYDGNGNIVALTREDGLLAAIYEYSPFGEPLRRQVFDATIADQAFGFSTKFTDSETGLVYYGARFYSPSLGRFINRDPIEEDGGHNLYGFCGNDPVNNHDYLGLIDPPVLPTFPVVSTPLPPLNPTVLLPNIGDLAAAAAAAAARRANTIARLEPYQQFNATFAPGSVQDVGPDGVRYADTSFEPLDERQGPWFGRTIQLARLEVRVSRLADVRAALRTISGLASATGRFLTDAVLNGQTFRDAVQLERDLRTEPRLGWKLSGYVVLGVAVTAATADAITNLSGIKGLAKVGLWKAIKSVAEDAAESAVPMVDRVRNVAQRSFDYAVQNPRTAGLNRMQLGKDAEVQATRWMRKWAERNGVEGLEFQVRGAKSVPDVVFDPARQIFDFKLTPKAVRPAQTLNFQNDFPGYGIDYIFGPGPWR